MSRQEYTPEILVLGAAGTVGLVGMVPSDCEFGAVNGSCARIAPASKQEGYLCAYLNSKYGYDSLTRIAVGSVQKHLNLEDLPELQIPIPSLTAQTYIGDKVRQAEQLRAQARELRKLAFYSMKEYTQHFTPSVFKKKYRVSGDNLIERLHPWYNNPHFISTIDFLEKLGWNIVEFSEITDVITNGGTPSGYSIIEDGIPWIRGKDFSDGDIVLSNVSCIDRLSEKSLSRSRLETGDLIINIKKTVGDVAVIDEYLKGCNINQDIARIAIGNEEIAHFLALFLESDLGQVLVNQHVYGAINPFFSLNDLRKFKNPNIHSIDDSFRKKIAYQRKTSIFLNRTSQFLTKGAKLLVEAMIEGKIPETELIAAQKALESGDREADRKILSRLTAKGMDIPGEQPLFPALDGLYEALDALNTSEKAP